MHKKEPKLEKHAEKLVILSAYLREGKKIQTNTKQNTEKKIMEEIKVCRFSIWVDCEK